MFRNLRLNIFAYYFLTVSFFLFILYYFLRVVALENIYILAVVLLCFVVLSGVFISKLAIDPLAEYVKHLQNLSKETLHELNLPISTIMTNAQMLRRVSEDEKYLKRVQRIESACSMLQERYNELDYMIKMQSKQDVIERFFLDTLVEERVAFVSKLYPNIEFRLSLDNLEIDSDKIGLAKAIDNIIDNGVKYSSRSFIIDITIEGRRLFIKDYGIGMDEVELVHIFDQYYQSNSTVQGFGIGLSMVKRFCDANDIELRFISAPNRGTTVEMKFSTK